MENLYYNLSEEEFSKSKKVLLWSFSSLFFLAGIYVLVISLVFNKPIAPVLSIAPFGISLIVGVISSMASFKRKNLFFSIDENKIAFRYGFFKPVIHNFLWTEIREVTMPLNQKKAQLLFKDGSSYVINLTWLQGKKSSKIKKHLYYSAKANNLIVKKVSNISDNN